MWKTKSRPGLHKRLLIAGVFTKRSEVQEVSQESPELEFLGDEVEVEVHAKGCYNLQLVRAQIEMETRLLPMHNLLWSVLRA